MKWALLVVVVMLTLARPALAQSGAEQIMPLRIDAVTLDKAYKQARLKRNVGISLAVPGVASTLLGCVLVAYAETQERHAIFSQYAEILSGSLLMVAGTAVGIPGIVLWMRGQDDMDTVKWRRAQMAPLISVGPRGGVAGLRVTF